MAKFDPREEITKQIIETLEAGTPPWRKPWSGEEGGAAFPLRSNGEPYRGINVLVLWMAAAKHGYASAHWFTFRQAKEMGAHVRKGEKSQLVVKYGTIERKDEDADEVKKIPYMRGYRVFNADQIEGLPEQFYHRPEPPRDLGTKARPELDQFFAALGAKIITHEKPRAFYHIPSDTIHMPPVATFHDAAGYYGTLAHEACHATGHKSRLDRFEKFQDRKAYAFEELIAEIGSCFLAAEMGFCPPDMIEQSAAYLQGWLKALNEDHAMIFKAASEAQKAADLIKEKAAEASDQVAA